jgi:soluble P-type ATPase
LLTIEIPGLRTLRIEHLVLDYNGTLACDGRLLKGVRGRLKRLARNLRIHVVTADTFGKARAALAGLPCEIVLLPTGKQDAAKLAYIRRLDPTRCLCIGNGRNDRLMLRAAALSIAVMLTEGAAGDALHAAPVVTHSVADALDLLIKPLRLVATLRS